MPIKRSVAYALAALGMILLILGAFWLGRHTAHRASNTVVVNTDVDPAEATSQSIAPTTVYAHNILLQKGPSFRIYIRWIRGEMLRTNRNVDPSFDDSNSFVFSINKGVITAHLQDLVDFLNSGDTNSSPLKNISIQASNNQIEIHGTVHKVLPLPVKLVGQLSPMPDGRLRFHVASYSILKVPMKGLFHMFNVKLSDLAPSSSVPGVQISGNDILFDTEQLMPPPHIQGKITTVNVSPQDITLIYGNSPDDENRLSQWHNFLRFEGGSLDFGKLTMHNADITMIDASNDPWFDLDLTNYQAQIVKGYTRMTAQAGLEIFMPNLNQMHTQPATDQGITLEWLKNRNNTLPVDVTKAMQSSSN